MQNKAMTEVEKVFTRNPKKLVKQEKQSVLESRRLTIQILSLKNWTMAIGEAKNFYFLITL